MFSLIFAILMIAVFREFIWLAGRLEYKAGILGNEITEMKARNK